MYTRLFVKKKCILDQEGENDIIENDIICCV